MEYDWIKMKTGRTINESEGDMLIRDEIVCLKRVREVNVTWLMMFKRSQGFDAMKAAYKQILKRYI